MRIRSRRKPVARIRTTKGRPLLALLVLALLTLAGQAVAEAPGERLPTAFGFDSDPTGKPPTHFSFGLTGSGREGRWIVQAAADAPSKPNALAQLDADATDYRFPIAVAGAPALRDLKLSARCKPVSGRVDQACGLVWRYRDANNYYLTRANALEDDVRLYFVKEGHRKQIAKWSGPVKPGTWHTLTIEMRGDAIAVYFDGAKVMEAKDTTFTEAGKVGVWTKADSVTYFDDLTVEPLGP
jgi:hypothetical protein